MSSGLTQVRGITATNDETNSTFTGGTITNSTISNSPISGSTGSFTTVSANSAGINGDVTVSGKVTVGQAVSAASLHADTSVSANTGFFNSDVSVSGKVTVGQAVSAASFHSNATVSAAGDINTLTNFVAGARTVVVSGDTGRVNASIGSFSSIVSAGGEINTATNFVAGARTVVVSGDTGRVNATVGNFSGTVSANIIAAPNAPKMLATVFNNSGTPVSGGTCYNVASFTDNGVGDWTVTMTVSAAADKNNCMFFAVPFSTSAGAKLTCEIQDYTAKSVRVAIYNTTTGVLTDPDRLYVQAFGFE